MSVSNKKILAIHPYLIGLYFILEGFAAIANYVPLYEIIIPIGLISFSIYVFILLLNLLIRNEIKSGITAFIILYPTLFFTDILSFVTESFMGLGRVRYVATFLLIIITVAIVVVLKSKRKLFYFNAFLNVLTACYVIYGVILVYEGVKSYDGTHESPINKTTIDPVPVTPLRKSDLPDIYFIILDSYASSRILSESFNYDNSGFIAQLRQRGFFVAENSLSFTSGSVESIASTLNLYDDPCILDKSEEFLCRMVRYNKVMGYLQERSYEIVNLSFLKLFNKPKFYSIFDIGGFTPWKFRGLFSRIAFFHIATTISANRVYKVNLRIIDSLKKMPLARRGYPRFIYAHLMMPHLPWCFDRNGNIVPWFKRTQESDKDGYLEQLIYTNKVIVDLIDKILSLPGPRPVIILQGDHGYRWLKNGSEFDSRSILNAIYFQGSGANGLFYSSISPVNALKVILNKLFSANYELFNDI